MIARGNWVRKLCRFVGAEEREHCDLCGAVIPASHAHLIEVARRRLLCACAACAETAGAAYRRVPLEAHALPGLDLSDAEWDALGIPIGLAFFVHSTPDGGPVALYPSPAGAMQSMLSLEGWNDIVARNPVLATLEPDVEALLINRTDGRREYFRAPIDHCFALTGLIRRHWQGLAGGSEVWQAASHFFDALRTGEMRHG
ncbi:MAG: hypothetical protein JO209_02160 [Acidisphaera sp.]|nr:hypothetical protein [Acidisphaera sp.]